MNKKILLVLVAVGALGAFALSAYSWGPYNDHRTSAAQWCAAPQGPAHAMNGYTIHNDTERRVDRERFRGADFGWQGARHRHGRSGTSGRSSGPCW